MRNYVKQFMSFSILFTILLFHILLCVVCAKVLIIVYQFYVRISTSLFVPSF